VILWLRILTVLDSRGNFHEKNDEFAIPFSAFYIARALARSANRCSDVPYVATSHGFV
jgi:hypothetical protein